jgi:hypothetical protein
MLNWFLFYFFDELGLSFFVMMIVVMHLIIYEFLSFLSFFKLMFDLIIHCTLIITGARSLIFMIRNTLVNKLVGDQE